MATEVDEVERAEGSGDLDEVHVAGGADEDGDVVDLGSVEVQPEVGHGGTGLSALGRGGVGVDEMLPSGGMVGGDDGAHCLGGVEGGLVVVICVDGDAVERARGAFEVTVVDEALGLLEHGAVEGHRHVRGGLKGQLAEGLADAGGLLRGCERGDDGKCGEEKSGEGTDHYAECLLLIRHGFCGIVLHSPANVKAAAISCRLPFLGFN